MKLEFDFVFKYLIFCPIHIQRQPAPLYLVPTWMTPGPQRQPPDWGDTQTSRFQGAGVGQKEGWRLQDPGVVWERAVEPTGRWGISGGHWKFRGVPGAKD